MILRLDKNCTRAFVCGRVPAQALAVIDRALSFFEPGYFMNWEYKTGRWDGKRYLFHTSDQSFPVGLVDRVVTACEMHGFDVQIIDERPDVGLLFGDVEPSLRADDGTVLSLYDDQHEALRTFLSNPRGCLCLPTGSGKTELAAAVFKILHPHRCLFIANRRGLVEQTRDRLHQRLGEKIGMLGGGRADDSRRVTVATIQYLWQHFTTSRLDFFPSIRGLVVDEAHEISPKMWFNTLEVIHAPVRLGLSATVKEASRRMIVEAYLGPIVHHQSVSELVEIGRAAEPIVHLVRTPGPVLEDELDPMIAYDRGVVENHQRHTIAVDAIQRAIQSGWPFLVLVVRIKHGEHLWKLCHEFGIDIPFLHGQTPLESIEHAKRDLEARRIPGIIASTIFDQGIDLPNVACVIIASGGRSPLRTIQRVGRGLRRKPGENCVHIIDFYDACQRTLRNQSEERRLTYRRTFGSSTVVDSLDPIFL